MPIPRPLRDAEREVVQWTLEHAHPHFQPLLHQLDDLMVARQCSCGCATIDFQLAKGGSGFAGKSVIGDYYYGPDDLPFGAILYAENGVLSRLELYSFSATPARLPRSEELRPLSRDYEPPAAEMTTAWSRPDSPP